MKIFLTKSVWWPFGSQLMHIMHRLYFANKHGCDAFVYLENVHPAYSTFDGDIKLYFPNLNTSIDSKIMEVINANDDIEPGSDCNYIINVNIDNSGSVQITDFSSHTYQDICLDKFANMEATVSELKLPVEHYKHLLQPGERVNEIVDQINFTKEVDSLNGDYIAAHVRWTDKVVGWCQEGVAYDPDTYLEHISKLCDKFNTNNLVLNCDNIDAVNAFVNSNKKYNLNILYDKEEVLPDNDWKSSIFQRWALGGSHLKENSAKDIELEKDMLNGFKIFKTFMNCHAMVGCSSSAMYKSPYILRDNINDIDLDNLDISKQDLKPFTLPKTVDVNIRLQGKKEIGLQ